MAEVEIDKIATFGAIADVPAYQLPPEAWTTALNMRARDNGLESLLGWAQVFGTIEVGNDSFVKLLYAADGVDAATAMTDTAAGGGPHAATFVGNAQLDTAIKKFGSAALLFDGAGDRVTTPDAADLEPGSQNFVVDCFFNMANAGSFCGFIGRSQSPYGAADITLWIRRTSAGVIEFLISNGVSNSSVSSVATYTNVTNPGFHHVAGIRSGNVIYLAIDGIIVGSAAFSGSVNNLAIPWVIGDVDSTGAGGNPMNGSLDQIRVAIGTDRGWTTNFTPPSREALLAAQVEPHFLFPISGVAQSFWIYTSLSKAFVFDGATHNNITRQSAGLDVNYTAANTEDWNGTLLGGIPILNNGADIPQFWPTQSVGTRLSNLTNWPSTLRARVIRAFGPFLVGFSLIDSGNALPHTAQWSHPAVPGAVPSSWDYTDQTLDAGRKDFPDVQSGILQDALPFGQTMFVYKESSTWKMRFVGGRFIFDFGESAWLTTSGILAARCVCNTSDGTKQVVVTQDDIIWHNGNTVNSILDKRQRKRLFSEIDTAAFGTSFLFDNPLYKEVWFCYPGPGQTTPDRAIVMNYAHGNVWPITEVDGITFRNAAVGGIEGVSDEDWEANEELWDDDTGPWSDLQRRRVLLASPVNTKIYNMDSGLLRDAATINTVLQRIGQSITGKTRDGDPVVDFQKMMMWKRIWPKVQGGPLSIRFGSQQLVDGPLTWGIAEIHDSTVRPYSDPGPVSGRANALEFAGSGVQWRIDGYKLDVESLGDF